MALQRIQKRKEKRQKVVMGIVLSFLMVASGFGVYLSGRGSEQYSLKDYGVAFSIDQRSQLYTAKLDGKRLEFYYLPSGVSGIEFSQEAASLVRGAPVIVFTFDPASDPYNLQVLDLIRFDLSSAVDAVMISAVTEESTLYSLPVVVCENATAQLPVLSWEESDEVAVVSEGYCLRLLGNRTDFLVVRDRLLYEYYGVYDEG